MAFWNRNYDRDYGSYRPRTGYGAGPRYGQEYGFRGASPTGMWGIPNEPEYGYYGGRYGYDANYKSQWQTDNGDPYGDRPSHTPMRMIRGEYEGPDRGYRSSPGYDRGYDRGYTGYSRRPGGYRGYGRGYDAGWY
ncbi:MAG TPA: hypothetical protein VFI91_12535 [Longimicrobiaceae bacterium]|nr:hypothetical protein [Longimicrobiaceae bacterium]